MRRRGEDRALTPSRDRTDQTIERAATPLDPALLRIVEAMARADARRDYDRAQSLTQSATITDAGGASRLPAP